MIVAGEVVRIHSYLLKAPKLRYLVGGSLLLETFCSVLIPKLAEAMGATEVHLKAAARFIVEFSEKGKAEHFAAITRFFGISLFGEESLLICGPVNKNADTLNVISKQLESQKLAASRRPFSSLPACQYMERCTICGSWGAAYDRSVAGEPEKLCHACELKYRARERAEICISLPVALAADNVKGVAISPAKGGGSLNLHVQYAVDPYENPVRDFRKLAEDGASQYLGIFYADGNSMGELLHDCHDVGEYSKRSEQVSEWNNKALAKAVSAVSKYGRFPGLILIKGGDDLLAVMPAEDALTFADTFLAEASSEGSPFSEGICGALVLSKPTVPFKLLYSKAEELLTNAKRHVWSLRHDATFRSSPQDGKSTISDKSAIDFIMVTSPLVQSLYTLPDRRKHILFTARPYLIAEYSKLLNELELFKRKWDPPRRLFMELKEIFYPMKIEAQDKRVDKEGRFTRLNSLCNRMRELYRSSDGEFLNRSMLDERIPEWSELDDTREAREAVRTWQADIIELVDFI
jgi:hypothetical protein